MGVARAVVGRSSWSTDTIAEDDRLVAWGAFASEYFGPFVAEPVDQTPFRMSIDTVSLGPLRLYELHGSAHRLRRGEGVGRSCDDGNVYVNAQLTGFGIARRRAHVVNSAPEHLAMMPSSWLDGVELPESFGQLIVQIPAELMLPRLARPDECFGRVLPAVGAAGLALHQLQFLARRGEELDPQAARLSAAHLVDLLVAAFDQPLPRGRALRRGNQLQAAMTIIERRLADPALSVGTVAAELHVSPRQLQSLFAEAGTTFRAWTSQQRLGRCVAAFDADPAGDRTIAEIASAWCFADRSHFSRVFATHLGVSPRMYRQRLRELERTRGRSPLD